MPRAFMHVVDFKFGDDPAAVELVDRFLRARRDYQRSFAEDLLALARTPGLVDDQGWARRRLAALMLQHQVLLVPPGDRDEHALLLEWLGLLVKEGSETRVLASALHEGYTTRDLPAFIRQFRRHLNGLLRIVLPLRRRIVSTRAIRDFLACSRQECKLVLARYLFSIDDVVDRIHGQVRRSDGLPAILGNPDVEVEFRLALDALPAYEARLTQELIGKSQVYWVADQTPARLNSLVENPNGTLVLAVKPPGSSVEIEIKRVGGRRDRPLDVLFARDGQPVPESHRLDGGSMERLLQEAGQVARLAKIYRFVHGIDPPVARIVSLNLIQQTSPTQAVLVGTSAFRLAQLARYFSPDGFRHFVEEVPGAKGTRPGTPVGERRRFADTLLEEVLGVYELPESAPKHYGMYVGAALSARRNRARADRMHVALAEELGTFCGTLLAIKAFTNGESFVARNVGIRRVWQDGAWQVHLVFLDHDDMHFADQVAASFDPRRVILGMMRDEVQVALGAHGRLVPFTILDHLGAIYRSNVATKKRAEAAMRRAMIQAHRKAQERWNADPTLGGAFSASFRRASHAWDRAVAAYLVHCEQGSDNAAWRCNALKILRRWGVNSSNFDLYLESIEEFSSFLLRHAFLFRSVTSRRS